MRHVLFAGALAVAALVQTGSTAQAREYPWCARYGWTTYNCGFDTYNQCLATISGVGGRCEPNPRFVAAEPRAKKRYRQ
jgi:Protein of unknown function (DUF3551)